MNRSGTLFDQSLAAEAAIEPHSAFLARAASAREAGDDRGAELALGAYLTLRAVDRAAALGGDAAPDAREGFRFQAQAALRFVDRLPKTGEVEASHLEGVARALTDLGGSDERRLRINLLAYSWYLEQAGHVEEAVDALAASEPFYRSAGADELTNLGMTAGRFHRTLAHWELADRGYALGYDSAEARQDVRGMLLARLGRAKVLLGRGNLPEARRQMEAIIAEADGKELAEVRGYCYQDLAAVFDKQDLPIESLKAQYGALQYLRGTVDRSRVFGNMGSSFRALGMFDTARIAFEQVLRDSSVWQLRVNALVELIAVHSALGDELSFRRYWTEAEAEKAKMPPSTAIDFRYSVGSGLAQFGRAGLARRWLLDAQQIAEANGLHEWYFRLESALRHVDEAGSSERVTQARSAETSVSEALAEVSEGLRRHADSVA